MASGKVKSKSKPPELKVVLDTNAIYTQSNSCLLNHEIFELIKASTKHKDLTITWFLPEIVRHERQYQMLKQSVELLPSVQKLERILGHNLNITEDIIKQRVEETINRQVKDLNINLIQLNLENVDWNRLILDAAYRQPPFSATEKEKGFRDALITESFIQLVSVSPKTPKICRVALVTNDGLLAKAVMDRTGDAGNIRVLLTLEELKGLINTLVSEMSEEFIGKILPKATSYFFEPGQQNTLFYKEKVSQRLRDEFGEKLRELPSGADEREQGTTYIGPPRFVKKEGQRIFWVNRISVEVKAYKYESSPSTVSNIFGTSGLGLTPSYLSSPGIGLQTHTPKLSSLILASIIDKSKVDIGSFPIIAGGKSLYKTGKIIFEVTWSVSVTRIKESLSKPKIESVRYVEAVWE